MNIFGLSVIFFVRKLSACTGSNTCHRNKEGKFNSYRNRDPYFNFRSNSSELSHYSIIIMMMMMINFYSAISQWSNDALQKFMKNYNKLCHLLLNKNLHYSKPQDVILNALHTCILAMTTGRCMSIIGTL